MFPRPSSARLIEPPPAAPLLSLTSNSLRCAFSSLSSLISLS
jgi:hypothetical protein